MAVLPEHLAALRAGLAELPELAHHVAGTPVDPARIYFPPDHAAALDPDVSLVVGNRGVGKSFWASALAEQDGRDAISRAYGANRSLRLGPLVVRFGFSTGEGSGDALVDSRLLASAPPDMPLALVWRAVVARGLAPVVGTTLPERFADLVSWLAANPDDSQILFRGADKVLNERDKQILILFDQLELMADDWRRVNELTKALLQTALAMQGYRNIRLKIFIRPDQFANQRLFGFPDASKIRGGAKELRWRAVDLFALLYFELLRNETSASALRAVFRHVGISDSETGPTTGLPFVLRTSEEKQKDVFEFVAGKLMGRNERKGFPYKWLPLHLSDARGEVSPRTFLKALKVAADGSSRPTGSAIDFNDIKDGVRSASQHRLEELFDDYPWVSEALEPLRGQHVPAEESEVRERWMAANVVADILKRHEGVRAPIDLEVASLTSVEEEIDTLLRVLRDIGVMDIRKNGKIDVPDIFRVRAGILRRGGVPPQQRRRL
ncbi:hypothetical protein [Azospirillum sp. ST 5-10]|uniref:hypothetical protein n=1 Tax=unclassified Azospirillum TaxID=2630922 RepID=UPI003F49B69D